MGLGCSLCTIFSEEIIQLRTALFKAREEIIRLKEEQKTFVAGNSMTSVIKNYAETDERFEKVEGYKQTDCVHIAGLL